MENIKNYRKIILDKYISSFYEGIHSNLPRFSLGGELNKYFIIYKHNYSFLLPKDSKASILELGPGMGQFLEFLKYNGYKNVKGIDGSIQIANHCKKQGLVVEYVQSFTEFLKDKSGFYDTIIANDILEHFKKDELFDLLSAMKETMRPGGYILGKVPNASACFMGTHTRYIDFTHELSFTEQSLKEIFYALGFSKVEIFEHKLFCYYYNPLNYIGIILTFALKYLQIIIHRLNGNFGTKIVSANLIFKAIK